MTTFYASYPPNISGSGVPNYPNLASFPTAATAGNGSLAVALDTDTLYISTGTVWDAIGSPSTVLSIGTFDSEGAPSANSLTISANALIAQSADATHPGMVNASTQTFGGVKTFSSNPIMSGLTASQAVVTDGLKALASLGYATAATPSTLVERDISGNVNVVGANVSGLTASQAVVTDASKNLASLAYTTAATPTTLVERDGSGNINVVGANVSGLTASQAVVTDGSKNLASLAYATTATATTLVERDSNANIVCNNVVSSSATVVSAGGTTNLTPGNSRVQILTGTLAQTFKLPNANTLAQSGATFEFNNNSTGILTVQDFSAGAVCTVPSGGYARVICTDTSTSAGVWDKHFLIPANGNYGTAGQTVTGTFAATSTVQGTQLISTVATGTAPLSVTSTTQVPNLYVARAALADTVTTNANLTGDVTSVGNATTYNNTVPVAKGGTGLTSGTSGGILGYTAAGTLASSAALTASQLVIGGGAGFTPSSLAAGTQYQVLTMGATTPGYGAVNLAQTAAVTGILPGANVQTSTTSNAGVITLKAPTVSIANAVSSTLNTGGFAGSITTYTTPAGCLYIKARMVGGGGGGAGSGSGPDGGAGGNGGSTTFSVFTAGGGTGGTCGNSVLGGAGGTASGSGSLYYALTGGQGSAASAGSTAGILYQGGAGGATVYGGGGAAGSGSHAGGAAAANTGAGGGGAGALNTSIYAGTGGGSGGYIEFSINSPSATYSYAVGSSGGGGIAGTGASATTGGAGAVGLIYIEEHYY